MTSHACRAVSCLAPQSQSRISVEPLSVERGSPIIQLIREPDSAWLKHAASPRAGCLFLPVESAYCAQVRGSICTVQAAAQNKLREGRGTTALLSKCPFKSTPQGQLKVARVLLRGRRSGIYRIIQRVCLWELYCLRMQRSELVTSKYVALLSSGSGEVAKAPTSYF